MKNLRMNSLRPAMLTLALLMMASLMFGQTRKKIDVSDFHALRVSHAFVIEISVGNEESLEIEMEDAFLDDLIAEVRGERLIIGLDNDNWKKRRRMKSSAKAYLTVKSLDEINISGAVNLRTLDVLESKRMKIDVSGASVVSMELDTEDLTFGASGACVMKLEGKATNQKIKMSGSSVYRAYDLDSEYVNVRVSGASTVNVSVSDELDVRASGASSIRYKGGASVNKDTSGASSVRRGK